MEFVINEWFLEWHKPDATPEEQQKARTFTKWLINSEHRIVMLRDSDFTRKLNQIRRDFNFHYMSNLELKLFFSQVIINPARCRIIDEPPVLPDETIAILKRPSEPPLHNIESDIYLFEAAEATIEKIIVTTDTKLIDHFEGQKLFKLWNTEDFFLQLEI
jgi:hypothetical protein